MFKFFSISILIFSFILSGCATAQTGYGTNNKRAIKLYNEARNAPRENIDLKTGRPDFQAGANDRYRARDRKHSRQT